MGRRPCSACARLTFFRTSMYRNYFGLKEKPFSIAPDPRYLFMSEPHREALTHLLYGVGSDGCFILLTGDVGTGKTTLSRCLQAQLPGNTDFALIDNPRLTVLEFVEAICDELGIRPDGVEKNLDSYTELLRRFLIDAQARGRNVALLIDEAQNLSLALLEQLRLLINLKTDQKKLLKVILLGQTELRQILKQEGAAEISQRITSRYHLLPLDRESSAAYVQHRLAVGGEAGEIFSQRALDRVYELSGGVPRLMNVLCDQALLGTYEKKKYLVTAEIVEKAGREVLGAKSGGEEQKIRNRTWLAMSLVAGIMALGAGAVFYYPGNRVSVVAGPSEDRNAPAQLRGVVEAAEETESKPASGRLYPDKAVKPDRATIRIAPLEMND